MVQAFGFGTSRRDSPGDGKESKIIPGPGQYGMPDATNKKRAPSWVMGSQRRVEPGTENKIQLAVPGPTAYNVPSRFVEGPKITLSPRTSGQENKFIKIVPGPGTYTPSTTKKADFSFSFGLKTQTDFKAKYIATVPGPGQYEQTKQIPFSRIGASLDQGQRDQIENKTKQLVPGPGRYEPTTINLISRNSAPKYGFGTSSRLESPADQRNISTAIEGQNKSMMTSNQEITKSFRLSSPGPGTYEIKNIIGQEGFKKTMSGRYQADLTIKEVLAKPGPGQYDPINKAVLKNSPNYRVGTSIREKYYLKDKYKYELPPPNVYDPKLETVKKGSPAAGFGYGDRSFMNRTFTAPGPGTYKTPTRVGEGPKYQMGIRLEDHSISKKAKLLPSPNHYDPKIEFSKTQMSVFSIGRSKRPSMARQSLAPGPGQYYDPTAISSFKESPKFGFGSSIRPEIGNGAKKNIPGPGSYKLKSTFADVPNYLIPNQKDDFKYV